MHESCNKILINFFRYMRAGRTCCIFSYTWMIFYTCSSEPRQSTVSRESWKKICLIYCGGLFCVYVCVWHECVCVCYVGQVARHLCGAGHEVHVVTVAPEFVFRRDIPSPKLHIRKVSMSFPCIQTSPIKFSSLTLSLSLCEISVSSQESCIGDEGKVEYPSSRRSLPLSLCVSLSLSLSYVWEWRF